MTRFFHFNTVASVCILVGAMGCTRALIKRELEPLSYFQGTKACFLLYNMKSKTFDKILGEEACRDQLVACSTFKIPLSIMAFDSGILKDENQILKWDGVKGFLEQHNHDHSAKTWLKDSVVWSLKD